MEPEDILKSPSGLRRTLSSEWVEKQAELRLRIKIQALVERQTVPESRAIIKTGETNRDLFFLTKGIVEISMENEGGNLVLNEISPPYLLGEIGFLSGFPRTATATAKTEVEIFVLRHEGLMALFEEFPNWLPPLITSFASSIKSLHYENSELQQQINQLKNSQG